MVLVKQRFNRSIPLLALSPFFSAVRRTESRLHDFVCACDFSAVSTCSAVSIANAASVTYSDPVGTFGQKQQGSVASYVCKAGYKKAIALSGDNKSSPNSLQACTGECDADSHCASGLKCFQRSNGEPIPGCVGDGGGKDWDYCYVPEKALSGGNDGGAKNLEACVGECDNDGQCLAGLKCLQRSQGENIHGCTGNGAGNTWDYCYVPSKKCGGGYACKQPTHSQNPPHTCTFS